jgi:hypothetical protein
MENSNRKRTQVALDDITKLARLLFLGIGEHSILLSNAITCISELRNDSVAFDGEGLRTLSTITVAYAACFVLVVRTLAFRPSIIVVRRRSDQISEIHCSGGGADFLPVIRIRAMSVKSDQDATDDRLGGHATSKHSVIITTFNLLVCGSRIN